MSKEDLIPLGKDPEHDAKVRAKLKGSGSDKRKFAQSLRRLKENPNKIDSDIFELINNPDASASQIQEMIKTASQMDMKAGEFIQLINTVIRKHSAIFGTKQENTNININKTTLWERMIKVAEEGNEEYEIV